MIITGVRRNSGIELHRTQGSNLNFTLSPLLTVASNLFTRMMDAAALEKLGGSDPASLVNLAKVAEQAERYEDMAMAMSKLVKESNRGLQEEERNLLSVAFKNVLGGLRSAWRIMSSLHEKAKASGEDEKKLNIIQSFLSKIEEELKSKCNEVLVSCLE